LERYLYKKIKGICIGDSDDENIDDDRAKNLTEEDRSKLEKIRLPKRKFAIIHGYNGHQFHGNQK